MNKVLAYASSALLASQAFVQRAFAQLDVPSIPGLPNATGTEGIKQTIIDLVVVVLDFVLLLAVVFVIVAGIRLIVSGGDDGQKDTAKKTIIYVIVGIIVILLARVIVSFVAGLI